MKKILLSLVVSAFSICIIAQNSAELKLKPEKNKTYRFKSTSDQTTSQTVNGMQQASDTKSNTVISLKVVDSTPEFMIAEIRFDSIITNTEAMGTKTAISSANEGNISSTNVSEVMSCILNRFSKNPIFAKLDVNGKVLDIVNYDMFSEIVLKDTALITGQTAPVIKTQIASLVGKESLKNMIEGFTHNLPGRTVKTGEKWEMSNSVVSSGMELDFKNNYSLETLNNNIAGINFETSIKAAENAGPMMSAGMKINYNSLQGMSKGDLKIDTLTGLIKESNNKTHITGNLDISVSGMNLQVPLEINSDTKIISYF